MYQGIVAECVYELQQNISLRYVIPDRQDWEIFIKCESKSMN